MSNREKLSSVILAIFVAIICDRAIYNGFSGLGYSLLMFSLLLLYYVMLRDRLQLKGNKGLIFLIPVIIAIVRSTIYDNQPVHILNVLFLPILMTSTALIIWFKSINYCKLSFIGELLGHIMLYPLVYAGKPFSVIKQRLFSPNGSKAKKINPQVLAGIVITIPLLMIVLAFLSSADMMFSYYVEQFFSKLNFFDNVPISNALSHIILVFIFTLYFFSFVWSFSERNELPTYGDSNFAISSVTISIPLSMLNIIYLLFSIVQFSYLYGNGQLRLPDGFTYAEYARRGFFELVAVAVINFTIILIGLGNTKASSEKSSYFCKILYTLLAVFTLNMLYSAHYKMRLYETVYGYTYLRVYVHLFMVLLLALSLAAIGAVWHKAINLPKIFILGSLVLYTILNVVNVDAFIAKQNINIYKQKGKIDVYYLTTLSDDAVPYLIDLTNDSTVDISSVIKDDLNFRRQRFKDNAEKTNLFNFNFSRSRARRLLN